MNYTIGSFLAILGPEEKSGMKKVILIMLVTASASLFAETCTAGKFCCELKNGKIANTDVVKQVVSICSESNLDQFTKVLCTTLVTDKDGDIKVETDGSISVKKEYQKILTDLCQNIAKPNETSTSSSNNSHWYDGLSGYNYFVKIGTWNGTDIYAQQHRHPFGHPIRQTRSRRTYNNQPSQ